MSIQFQSFNKEIGLPKQVRKVNVNKILNNEIIPKFPKIVQFHHHLSNKGLFTIEQQEKFIKKLTELIYHHMNNSYEKDGPSDLQMGDEIEFMDLMLSHLVNPIFDLEKLSDRETNPLTVFLDNYIGNREDLSNKEQFYVSRLIDLGDTKLPTDEYIDFLKRFVKENK